MRNVPVTWNTQSNTFFLKAILKYFTVQVILKIDYKMCYLKARSFHTSLTQDTNKVQ